MRLFEDPPAPAFLARRFRWALDRARYLAPLGRGREPLAEVQRAALVEARGVA
jgi:hypothetical protein